jgi:hypothetical protein
MISNPENGWCDFKLGDFHGEPSYLVDVPVELLNMFINFHKTGAGVAWFDEEGSEFTIVLNPYSLFIIEECDEPVLHDLSELNIYHLENELI